MRPDGILGLVAPLGGFAKAVDNLSKIVIRQEHKKAVSHAANGYAGELINLDENNLYYQQANIQSQPVNREASHVTSH